MLEKSVWFGRIWSIQLINFKHSYGHLISIHFSSIIIDELISSSAVNDSKWPSIRHTGLMKLKLMTLSLSNTQADDIQADESMNYPVLVCWWRWSSISRSEWKFTLNSIGRSRLLQMTLETFDSSVVAGGEADFVVQQIAERGQSQLISEIISLKCIRLRSHKFIPNRSGIHLDKQW